MIVIYAVVGVIAIVAIIGGLREAGTAADCPNSEEQLYLGRMVSINEGFIALIDDREALINSLETNPSIVFDGTMASALDDFKERSFRLSEQMQAVDVPPRAAAIHADYLAMARERRAAMRNTKLPTPASMQGWSMRGPSTCKGLQRWPSPQGTNAWCSAIKENPAA